MVDARWYLILKEFEYVPTIEPGADLDLRGQRDSDVPSGSRKLKVGLVLAAVLMAAILISSLPAV